MILNYGSRGLFQASVLFITFAQLIAGIPFMRFFALLLLFFGIGCCCAYAQQEDTTVAAVADTVAAPKRVYQPRIFTVLDSVAAAMRNREKQLSDSLSLVFVSRPDAARHSQFYDLIKKQYFYKGYGFYSMPSDAKHNLREGHSRHTRDPGVLLIILGLLVYTALLTRIMSKDVQNVWESFYSKRILSQVSKEDGLFNSWGFIGLFLLFGFTFGLFIYQLAGYNDVFYSISGPQLFLSFSLLIIILFAVKLILLRFIGLVFNISRLVAEYISILYLTYFNITFVFLPVLLCFSLLAAPYIPYMLGTAVVLIIIIFVWQYLRSSVNIISSFKFHKFYLFIYLCALEICPILILIKALNI
ncbi:DUF4271 domain-containing protein [Mucilaginibacter sp.]